MERVEKKVVKSAIRSMIQIQPIQEEEESANLAPAKVTEQGQKESEIKKKRNERSFERYRGKAENGVKTKPMSYYISDQHIQAIELKIKKGTEKDKSAVVRAALEMYLKTELKEIRRVGN